MSSWMLVIDVFIALFLIMLINVIWGGLSPLFLLAPPVLCAATFLIVALVEHIRNRNADIKDDHS